MTTGTNISLPECASSRRLSITGVLRHNPLNDAAIHYTRLDLKEALDDLEGLVRLRERQPSLDPAAASEFNKEIAAAEAAVDHHTTKLETLIGPMET